MTGSHNRQSIAKTGITDMIRPLTGCRIRRAGYSAAIEKQVDVLYFPII
jgi:hypothetical protein